MDTPSRETHYSQPCDACGLPLEICECGQYCDICDQPFDRCDCDNDAGVDEDYGSDIQPEDRWGPPQYTHAQTGKGTSRPVQTAPPPQPQSYAQKPQPSRTTPSMMPDFDELQAEPIETIVMAKPKQPQHQPHAQPQPHAQKPQPSQQPPPSQQKPPANKFQIQLELGMLNRILDEKKALLQSITARGGTTVTKLEQDVEVLDRIIGERLALLNAAEASN